MDAPQETTRTLVVGVDGSEGSRRALEWAARHAGDVGAEVVAVHVLTLDHELLVDLTPDTVRSWRLQLGERLRGEWVTALADVPHRGTVIEADSAASGLVRAAEDAGAELVVVGAQHRDGLRHRLLGGVTYSVAHRSPVPVVVVPAD